jgi:hypothetical protein
VFNTIDYRRYAAGFDGSGAEQVAASGGRPFVAYYDTRRILREGLADSVESRPDATTVDQGLCVPARLAGRQAARRHRLPRRRPDRQRGRAAGAAAAVRHAIALPIRELTTGASDGYPSFSPNGRKVTFERAGSVRVIAAAGGRARRLVKGTQPTWGRRPIRGRPERGPRGAPLWALAEHELVRGPALPRDR